MSRQRTTSGRVMPEVIQLAEYQTSLPVLLEPADLARLESVPGERLAATPTSRPGWFRLRASSWVGQVQLGSVEVRIMPKVEDLANVLMMFTSAAGITDWSPSPARYASGGLVEGVADLLLRTIDQTTRRGLLHGYRTREERLPVLRGRLRVAELATRPWEPWPAPCRYEEFTADIAENRVLLAAVALVRRWVVGPPIRRLAAELEDRFADVGGDDHTVFDPLLEAAAMRWSPINDHYQPAVRLAALVLEGFAVTHAVGRTEGVAFLVDMNRLYERWIGAELTARLWPGIDVVEQDRVLLADRPSVPMNPDLLFRVGGRPVLVGDVKYKLTGSGLARNADWYQLLAYATALDLPRGVLVYCQADEAPAREITVHGSGHRLTCYPLGLGGTRDEVATRLDDLAETLRRGGLSRASATPT